MKTRIDKIRTAEEIIGELGACTERVRCWSVQTNEEQANRKSSREVLLALGGQGRRNAMSLLRLKFSLGAALISGDNQRYERLKHVIAELEERDTRLSACYAELQACGMEQKGETPHEH